MAQIVSVASFVALVARSDYGDAIAYCPNNVCQTRTAFDATQDARTRANWMSVVSLAGIAAAGVGVHFPWTSKVTAAPMVAPNTVGIAIGGSL